MNCKIDKSHLSGVIKCPPNKSYSHRAIFLASLAGKNSRINNFLFSADTRASIETCKNFGAEILEVENSIVVKNSINFNHPVPDIDAKNSGTTIRIAAGIASLFENEITLTGDSSLCKRPMQPLLDALESLGAKCTSTNGTPPVTIKGKIVGGSVSIPGNLSSQFISALMICGPLTTYGINLNIEGKVVSKPYIDATIATMRNFGVSIKTLIPYKKYNVLPQFYKRSTFSVPTDFSSLALLLSASVLMGDKLEIKSSLGNLPQGDEVFIDILEKLGVKVSIERDSIFTDSPKKLSGGKFDLSDSPDLLPPLAILALKTSNPIEIINVKHARLKETDRISIIARELAKTGLKIREMEDGLILELQDELKGVFFNSEKDHRLFMAFCIAGMYIGDCMVTDSESVDVSYPNFITEMKSLGGKITL